MANMEKLSREYGKVIWTGKKRILGMPISLTRYILTETKLITRIGLFSIKEDEIELYRIYDKSLQLPFGQRIFGCGSISLMSKDSDTPTKKIVCVKAPREVKRLLDDAVQKQLDKYYVRGRDMIGAGAIRDNDEDDSING